MLILILTIIAVIGAIAVALGKPLAANILWILSNPAMAVYNYSNCEFELAGMFGIYSLVALYGIYNLHLKKILYKS